MKRFLTAVVAVGALAGIASAGPLTIGARFGSSVPNLRGGTNEISSGYSSRVAPYAGVMVELGVTPRLSLLAEVDYAAQGGKRDGMQPIPGGLPGLDLPPGTTLYANYRNEAKLDYLEIPVLAKVGFGARPRVFVQGGPFVGFLLSAKTVTRGTSAVYFDRAATQPVTLGDQPLPPQDFGATTDDKASLHVFNWGLQAGVGAEHPVGRGDLFVELRGGLGLANIQRYPATDGSNRTGALVVAAGYAFRMRP